MIGNVILCVLLITGVNTLLSPHNNLILAPVGRWLLGSRLPMWLQNPLWACPVCMSSIWGTSFYVISLYPNYTLTDLALYPVFILAVLGGAKICNS